MFRTVLNNIQAVDELISKLSLVKPGSNQPIYQAEIKEYKKNRSKSQNALMHMWFTVIAKEYFLTQGKAYSPEVWKEFFKEQYLGQEVIEMPNGKLKVRNKRTRDLKVSEMAAFLSDIDMHAGSEFEIQLPRPEDIYWEAMGIKK